MKLFTKTLAVAFVAAIALVAVSASAESFGRNLTIGSTGADVMALQQVLNSNPATVVAVSGVGSAGMESSYFGGLTKAAVAKYQVANGITPAVGYFGPITRAAINAGGVVVITPATGALCPNGMTLASNCTLAPNAQAVPLCPNGMTLASNCSVAPGAGVPSTNGVEGTLTLTSSNSGLASTLYEGDLQDKILGLKLEAKSSNITVQRVTIDLGTASEIYNKVLSRIYVMDGSSVIASSDLNSSTVVKDGSNYYITLTGFNVVVAKDTTKVLTVAVDVRPSVDSTVRDNIQTVRTAAEAVRGVDGAGLNQYTTTSVGTVTKSFTISSTLVDSAALKFSLNTASPTATTIIASSGSLNNEKDKVVGLIFNVKAEKDNILINTLTVTATGTAVLNGHVATAYLFDGSNELDNTSTFDSEGNATFSNVGLTISKDTTKVLSVQFDVRTASTSAETITVSMTSDTTDAENSLGDTLVAGVLSGSATGGQLSAQTAGPVYTLVGTPTLTKTAISNTASSTFLASFFVNVAAQGADVSVASTSAFVVGIYSNTGTLIASSTVGYDKPATGVTQATNGPYVIADGANATFNPQVLFTAPAGVYTAGTIATARIMSITATTNSVASTVTYIADTFRTGSQGF